MQFWQLFITGDMPFINVASAWKELAMSRVGLNETQALGEETQQMISEESRSIPINEAGLCESKPHAEQEENVSDAIRRARENFLNAVKSVSNGVQINSDTTSNNDNHNNTVKADPDASRLNVARRSSESRKYRLSHYPGPAFRYENGPSPRRRRLSKPASNKLTADWRASGTNGYPAGLSSLRNVISGSISALRSDWSSAMAASTCVPSVKADMVTLRIQNGRLELHRLPDDDDGVARVEEEPGQGCSDMSASGSGDAGCQQTVTAEQLTLHCVMAADGERTEMEQGMSLGGDAVKEVMTTYRSDPEIIHDPDVSSLDDPWSQYGANNMSSATNTLFSCSAATAQNTDYLEETGAADVIFDALITLINE